MVHVLHDYFQEVTGQVTENVFFRLRQAWIFAIVFHFYMFSCIYFPTTKNQTLSPVPVLRQRIKLVIIWDIAFKIS
jgi:hypothetical protein